jgi:AcrR family transcriptional regulator
MGGYRGCPQGQSGLSPLPNMSLLEAALAVTEQRATVGRSARKAKGDGHERRAEILAAAERLFVEQGYEGATIRKIADAVGLSSTALYMHFKDKAEILASIVETGFGKLAKVTDEIEAEVQPAEVSLRRKMRAYADFGFANPNAYRLIYLTRPGEAGSAEGVARRVGRGLYDRLRSTVEDMAKEGQLNRDPHTATQLIWGGVHGLVSLMLTKPYFDWDDRDELIDSMMNAIISDLTRG